jgi:thioredoxin 1
VVVGKVDVEEQDDLAAQFGIRNIPTVLFIKDGQVVDKIVGATVKANYVEKIKAML